MLEGERINLRKKKKYNYSVNAALTRLGKNENEENSFSNDVDTVFNHCASIYV